MIIVFLPNFCTKLHMPFRTYRTLCYRTRMSTKIFDAGFQPSPSEIGGYTWPGYQPNYWLNDKKGGTTLEILSPTSWSIKARAQKTATKWETHGHGDTLQIRIAPDPLISVLLWPCYYYQYPYPYVLSFKSNTTSSLKGPEEVKASTATWTQTFTC